MQLKVNDSLPLTIAPADEFGNPTASKFDSPPAWQSSDPTVAAVVASEDGLSAAVTSPSGKIASVVIQVSGVVGGQAVIGSLPLDMVPGDVAAITIQPGAPVAVPQAAPAPAPAAQS